MIFACHQYQRDGYLADSVAVCVALMCVYNFKFFLWETGYFNSMDIQHDRAGVLHLLGLPRVGAGGVRLPGALHRLRAAPVKLGNEVAAAIFLAGLLSIWINYDSDRQRQEFPRQRRQEEGVGRQAQDRRG